MSSRGHAPTSDVAVAERPAESRRRADRARRVTSVPAPEPTTEQPAAEQQPAQAPRLSYGVDSVATSAPAAPPEGQAPAGIPEPAAAPEPGVSAEQVAQREAQVAAAQAALDSAADTPGLMNAFADAPPTIKAQVSGELGSRFDSTLGQDSQALQQETPELHAEMQGNTPAPAGEIAAPAADVTLEEPPAEAPAGEEIVGAPVGTEEEFRANGAVVSQIARSFSPEAGAENIDRALDSVQTTDPSIVTSPGSAPTIPLEGETDPQRIQNQIDTGSQQAQDVLVEQQAQAQALPGAERVQLADAHESYSLDNVATPTAEDAPAPEGAQRYLELGQPAEVQTAFDDIAGAPMRESLTEARAQIAQAAQDRDQQHQDAVQKAERDTATAQSTAESDQRKQVTAARTEIETQRQSTVEQQQAAVTDVEQQATDRSADDRRQVDDRVRDDQQKLDDRYSKAEADSEAKVRDGERQAEEKRQRAERESEDQSWWEAALDFITDLFDALVSLINDIFDAVRAAVNAILDAVRDFALALIDLAAGFLKGLISAFGTFLKGLVQGLLGELFPELAQKLIGLIDDAVNLANSAIDTVANALKTAVNAIVDVLQAGINFLINVFQGAVNTALALARAALTGDWGAFIIQLIEAACRVAGLDPEQVFAFIGRAQETIQLIVDDPGQFLSNAVDALSGGIQRFADHFLEHLQAGIIAWLTGAIGGAGITLPARFDLMGVISLVAQILGLTWENLRLRLVRVIGERGVQILEFVASYLQTLIEGGWSALWERIQNDLGMLRDMVLEQIRNYLVERVIMAAITRLATLFNPVGALVNILIAAYNFYTFIRDQLQRIMQVVTVIVDAIGNIARGILGPAQESVERFLAGLLPLALDLLARLLGLGDVSARVREILQSVQDLVWSAIDRLINWVLGLFRGGAGAAAGEPVAQGAVGEGAAVDRLGEDDTFEAEGVQHHLYIEIRANDAVVIMASTNPGSVPSKLDEMEGRARVVQNTAKRDEILGKIGEARTQQTRLNQLADQLVAQPALMEQLRALGTPPSPALQARLREIEQQKDILKPLLDTALTEIHTALEGAPTSDLLVRFEEFRMTGAPPEFRLQPVSPPRFGVEVTVGGIKQIDGYAMSSRHPFFRDDYIRTMQTQLQAVGVPIPEQAGRDLGKGVEVRRMSRVGVEGSQKYAFTDGAPGYQLFVLDLSADEPRDPKMAKVVSGAIYADAEALVTHKGILAFMELMARQGTVEVEGLRITRADFEEIWRIQANADWIKDRFRDATSGMHEWIPSNLIPQVIDRTRDSINGAKITRWVGLQHEMRSDTSRVIFSLSRAQVETFNGQPYSVLHGHAGAMYLNDSGSGTPKTIGQPGFHDALRNAFGEPDKSIGQCIDDVITVFTNWVWNGSGMPSHPIHPLLRDGQGRMVAQGNNFATLASEQTTQYADMLAHLQVMKQRFGGA